MPPSDKAGRVVFIGNIPYGITEEQIIELFGRVGHVLGFRLVHDKETGRPKGFGFAEFADADAAASAVRNLNDHEMMGRKLRVDWSNDNGSGDNAPAAAVPAPPNGQPLPQVQQASGLDQLPAGTDIPPNITATDAISRTLSTLPPSQLLDILSQMKGVVMTDPAKAVDLLRRAPQLAYALFQSLLLLNLVQPDMLGQFIEPASAPPAPAPQQQPPPAQQPPRNYPAYPPQQVPTPVQAPPPQPQPQPPQPQAYAQPGLPPQVQAQLAQLPPEQQAQYATILALTPDQIAPLPPDQKSTIMQIRQVFGVR